MKPSKKVLTDTVQIDVTKQIADTIAMEENKLTYKEKRKQMSIPKNPDEYEHVNANIMEDQLDVAVRALHVISAMPSSDSEFLSSVAIDAC